MLLLIGLLAVLGGCVIRIGHPYEVTAFISRVERDVTTQGQVRGWLGAPSATGFSVDASGARYELWTYYYGRGTLPHVQPAELSILQIKFDRDGIVRAYEWSGSP